MDMSVFYTEDELRKQANTFTNKVNIRVSHMFTTSDTKTIVVLVFFGRIWPTVCSPGRHHRPGGPQHRQTASVMSFTRR